MTVGNIATDGYGLNAIERPNVPVNGYGSGLPTGIFEGSVAGIGISSEVVESFFEELLVIDAEIEHAVALDDTVTVTELTGTPLAQALMVGVDQTAEVMGADVTVEELEKALSADTLLSGSDASDTVLTGTTGRTYSGVHIAVPYADVYEAGWSDTDFGNDNGVFWDELNRQGPYLDSTIYAGVGIPEDPLPAATLYGGTLTPLDDPGTDDDHYVVFRAQGVHETPGGGVEATVAFYTNGLTLVTDWTEVRGTGPDFEVFRLPLTSLEASGINYSDMTVLIQISIISPDWGPYDIALDYVHLEVPDLSLGTDMVGTADTTVMIGTDETETGVA